MHKDERERGGGEGGGVEGGEGERYCNIVNV